MFHKYFYYCSEYDDIFDCIFAFNIRPMMLYLHLLFWFSRNFISDDRAHFDKAPSRDIWHNFITHAFWMAGKKPSISRLMISLLAFRYPARQLTRMNVLSHFDTRYRSLHKKISRIIFCILTISLRSYDFDRRISPAMLYLRLFPITSPQQICPAFHDKGSLHSIATYLPATHAYFLGRWCRNEFRFLSRLSYLPVYRFCVFTHDILNLPPRWLRFWCTGGTCHVRQQRYTFSGITGFLLAARAFHEHASKQRHGAPPRRARRFTRRFRLHARCTNASHAAGFFIRSHFRWIHPARYMLDAATLTMAILARKRGLSRRISRKMVAITLLQPLVSMP